MSPGFLVILSGPSGVGKDTVINAWRKRNPDVERVVAYTTRAPRSGEVDGVDYRFVTRECFFEMAQDGEFLEFKEVHDYHYATPVKDMERMLAEGKVVVLKIDVKGALAVMRLRPEAVTVFLLPPTGEELERRLRDRASDDDKAILRRLENAKQEMELADHYGHRIVNDDIGQVVDELERLVR
jgi:guanylate kinase